MQNKIILYNGPNSPFGRKTKITSLVQEITVEEKIIKVLKTQIWVQEKEIVQKK